METWGLVPKAQDDPQTIDEAIADAIANHEADPDAHLGDGEALDSHRASEIIDHLAESIVPDKLENNFFLSRLNCPQFQSLEPFNVNASEYYVFLDNISIWTSSSLNNVATLWPLVGISAVANFANDIQLNIPILLNCDGTYEAWFGCGDFSEDYNDAFVGFKVSGGHIYASSCDGNNANRTNVDLGVVSEDIIKSYRVEFFNSSHCNFYIDNILVATITTNLPTSGNGHLFHCKIKTLEAGKFQNMRIQSFWFEQS